MRFKRKRVYDDFIDLKTLRIIKAKAPFPITLAVVPKELKKLKIVRQLNLICNDTVYHRNLQKDGIQSPKYDKNQLPHYLFRQ